MCGIAGLFRLDGGPASLEPVRAMRAALVHRGPDDEGEWASGPVALGFRRLSILDLSGGHQPMHGPDERLVGVFNGEIYNHPQLKAELESKGARFRTRSDTETILQLYAREGLEAFDRLEGMFAVALWDGKNRELILARDPIGVKPVYYALVGDTLYFASELRALVAAGVPAQVDPAAVLDYLAYGIVHAPRTALASVAKLPPGHLLRAGPEGLRLERYWELSVPAEAPARMDPEEALERLESLLRASVKGQLLADVPVGAFLSGGVDSSVVTALMTQEAGKTVKTFSIGFSGARAGLDESAHAREVARHLGTDHHELVLPASVLDRMEDLAQALDEPISDSAILPTLLLSRFAREQVKVVLTGEGADELFAGYGRYKAAYLSEHLLRLPDWSRAVASSVARHMGKGRLFEGLPLETVGYSADANAHVRDEVARAVCRADFLADAERPEPLDWLRQADEPHSLSQALAYDLRTVLCDSLLMKVDKATMRASLEARVPFLDRSVVSFAFNLPAGLKLRRFKGKYILRRLAEKWLPKPVAWRRKHGFIVPWEEWVRDPKNALLDDLVRDRDLGLIFDESRLVTARRHLSRGGGPADAGQFFRVAVFALWLKSLKTGTVARA
ncbi:MAG: asparagine synthase (glutamine-hydrolyzing) [Elusimicrobia bacterium]|nr:asparagine synthase (glutamine-hydrolyzing) [Elusimicrobiota bacterium]